MKIINIVGARPNFMKIAPLMEAYIAYPSIKPVLVHTGQHYDVNMSDLFFKELNIPAPDIFLNVGSDTQARQVAKIMIAFEEVCMKEKPDAIMVAGDVNSTMACSLVAVKLGIKIIHLEAGLRSYDRNMPEEINRVVTDLLADILLIPSLDAKSNLQNEGITDEKIFFVGNIMIDTLCKFLPVIHKSAICKDLGLKQKEFILVTLHRPSNVDEVINLEPILKTLHKISGNTKIVMPLHPRTRKNITRFGLDHYLSSIILTEPLGYFDFQKLMVSSKCVITDSGGVQEETTFLKIPCITVRENTERPVSVTTGSNVVIGNNMQKLEACLNSVLMNKWKSSNIPDLWDGKTAGRVIEVLIKTI